MTECFASQIENLLISYTNYNFTDKKSDDSVKVAVRVRPLVKSEIVRGCQNILNKNQNSAQISINNNATKQEMFTFDYAFSPDESQEMIYANAVKPIVKKIFQGKLNTEIIATSTY